jgi:hypothetical protein
MIASQHFVDVTYSHLLTVYDVHHPIQPCVDLRRPSLLFSFRIRSEYSLSLETCYLFDFVLAGPQIHTATKRNAGAAP